MWMLLSKLEYIRGEDVQVCEDSGVLSLVFKKTLKNKRLSRQERSDVLFRQ